MLIFQTQSWWYIFLQPDRIRFRLEKKRRKKKGSLTPFPLGATCLDSWLCSGNWKTPSWSFSSFVCFSSRRGNPSTVTSVSCHHADPGQLSSRWVWEGLARRRESALQIARAKFWRLSGCFFLSFVQDGQFSSVRSYPRDSPVPKLGIQHNPALTLV